MSPFAGATYPRRDNGCTASYVCQAAGKVVSREVVKVPAGSFEAIKVHIEHVWSAASGGGPRHNLNLNGGRDLTIWYVPQLRRAVKFRSRLNVGDYPPVEPDFDLELVSYQLK